MNHPTSAGASSIHKPALNEIMDYLSNLAVKAQEVSSRLDAKLSPVCFPDSPSTEAGLNDTQRNYPPIFNDMRGYFNTIDSSLNHINNILDRCEL